MNKYAIILGKDPEYISEWCWPDNYENSDAFDKAFVAGKFETNEEDLFWKMFTTINSSPCTMWYWVVIEGETYLSGAIDPDDISSLAHNIHVPNWVLNTLD